MGAFDQTRNTSAVANQPGRSAADAPLTSPAVPRQQLWQMANMPNPQGSPSPLQGGGGSAPNPTQPGQSGLVTPAGPDSPAQNSPILADWLQKAQGEPQDDQSGISGTGPLPGQMPAIGAFSPVRQQIANNGGNGGQMGGTSGFGQPVGPMRTAAMGRAGGLGVISGAFGRK